MKPLRCAPQDVKSGDYEQVGGAVENSVPKRVELVILNGIHRVPAAQHVMPAKDLMKDDAVKKSAQAQTEQYAGRHGKMRSYCPFHEPPVPPPPIKTLRRARSNLSLLVKTPSSAPRAIAKGRPRDEFCD